MKCFMLKAFLHALFHSFVNCLSQRETLQVGLNFFPFIFYLVKIQAFIFNNLSDMHVYPLPQITICDEKAWKWANGPLKKIK